MLMPSLHDVPTGLLVLGAALTLTLRFYLEDRKNG